MTKPTKKKRLEDIVEDLVYLGDILPWERHLELRVSHADITLIRRRLTRIMNLLRIPK